MKILILVAAGLAVCGSVFAQDQGSSVEYSLNSGYGAMDFRISSLDGEAAGVFGARGAWISNHTFGVGGAGYGFTTGNINDESDSQFSIEQGLEGGYGGVLLEYYLAPQQPVQFNAGVVVGGGWIGRRIGTHADETYEIIDESGFFVTEPFCRDIDPGRLACPARPRGRLSVCCRF